VQALNEHTMSQRKASDIVRIPRSTARYAKRQADDSLLIAALSQLTQKHPAIGFWQCHHRLRMKGVLVNHKRLYRVYTSMHLNIRRRAKKRFLRA
jgi:putative transposase